MTGMEWLFVASMVMAVLGTGYNIYQTNQTNKQNLANQRKLMMDQAPLSMAGYQKAGVNPFANDASLSMSSLSAPQMEAPQIDTAQFSNLINAFSDVGVKGSQVDVNKKNIDYIKSQINVNDAQAAQIAKQCGMLDVQMDQAKETLKLISSQIETEGYKQKNLEASTNLVGEQALTEVENRNVLRETIGKVKAEKAEILSRKELNGYNLREVLPRTAKKIDAEIEKLGVDKTKAEHEIAEVLNRVLLSSADVEKAYCNLDDVLRKLVSDAASAANKSEAEGLREDARSMHKTRVYKDQDSMEFIIFDILGMFVDEVTNVVDFAKILGIKGLLGGKSE